MTLCPAWPPYPLPRAGCQARRGAHGAGPRGSDPGAEAAAAAGRAAARCRGAGRQHGRSAELSARRGTTHPGDVPSGGQGRVGSRSGCDGPALRRKPAGLKLGSGPGAAQGRTARPAATFRACSGCQAWPSRQPRGACSWCSRVAPMVALASPRPGLGPNSCLASAGPPCRPEGTALRLPSEPAPGSGQKCCCKVRDNRWGG